MHFLLRMFTDIVYKLSALINNQRTLITFIVAILDEHFFL